MHDIQSSQNNFTMRPANYEASIEIRGTSLSLLDVQALYNELQHINDEQGSKVLAQTAKPDDVSEEEWSQRLRHLSEDAFRLTITIIGNQHEEIYSESSDIFAQQGLPDRIVRIFFTNVNSYRRNAGDTLPDNQFAVTLDFTKPDLLDPNPLQSEATPNASNVQIRSREISFFNAVKSAVEKRALKKTKFSSFLHKNFTYDFFLWFFAFPASLLLSTHYMDEILPVGSNNASFRWAFFIFGVVLGLLFYRVLFSYAKWAFPVNVLEENRDTAWKHRFLIAGVSSWAFYETLGTMIDLLH